MKYSIFFVCFFLSFKLFSQNIEIPVIDSISVNQSRNSICISWKMSSLTNVQGYIVYRKIYGWPKVMDGAIMPIDTIYSAAIHFYEDTTVVYGRCTPQLRSEDYQIAAFDIIDGKMKLSVSSTSHSSLYLSNIIFDPCKATNTLSWVPYLGWGNLLASYSIYYKSSQTSNFQLLANVAKDQKSYVHTDLVENIVYQYYIQGNHQSGQMKTSSNLISISTPMDKPANLLYIDYVTSTSNKTLDINFIIDPTAPVKYYKILRSNSLTNPFDSIGKFGSSAASFVFNDKTSSDNLLYFYKFTAVNNCGIEYKTSIASNNVILTASKEINNSNRIDIAWNMYNGWPAGVNNYNLYRIVDQSSAELIQTLGGNTITFIDDIEKYSNANGGNVQASRICYFVEAEASKDNVPKKVGLSKSNTACISLAYEIEMPNAFNPNSQTEINKIFRPQLTIAEDYMLIIYNRWGMKVFESTQIENGWDGTLEGGKLAPDGIYTYYVQMQNLGKLAVKTGFLTLIYH